MYLKIKVLLYGTLIWFTLANAEVRLRIVAPPFTSQQLMDLSQINEKVAIKRENLPYIVESLLNVLRREGHPMATFDSLMETRLSDMDMITIFFTVGPAIYENYRRVNDLQEGSYNIDTAMVRLTETELFTKVQQILDSLTNKGFIFAQVTVKPVCIDFKNDSLLVDMEYTIERGPYIKLGEISFLGEVKSKPYFLKRATKLKVGQVLRREDLKRARRRLERLSFVESVGEPEVGVWAPGLWEVRFPIKERGAGQFGGMLTSASGSAILGQVGLKLGNILGTGRQVEFRWSRFSLNNSLIRLNYIEPWIGGLPLDMGFNLEQYQEGENRSQSTMGISVRWTMFDELAINGWISQSRVSKTATEPTHRTDWLKGCVEFNYLDIDWNPAYGWKMTVTSAVGNRRAKGITTSYHIRKEATELMGVLWNWDKLLCFGRLSGEDISGKGLNIFDLVRVGGMNSLRGYSEECILARGVLLGSLELRWRPNQTGYMGLFADGGWVYRHEPSYSLNTRFPSAVGFMTAFESKTGRVSLGIGLPKEGGLEAVRVHINLIGWF